MKLYYSKPEALSVAISGERRGVHLKPIIFNTDMVRAILDGRKTVTRRVIKPQPLGRIAYCMAGYKHGSWSYPGPDTYKHWGDKWKEPEGLSSEERNRHWTPPCHTDDILYVRETWADIPETHPGNIHYKASATEADLEWFKEQGWKWKPSIHMPTAAARIFLRVTDVRIERLQDIDDEGAKAEGANYGIGVSDKMRGTAIDRFAKIWNHTIKKNDIPQYGWDANPWVWVIEFERCDNPGSREVNDNG